MININQVIEKLENFAPLDLAQEWDNSGWQINLGNTEINNILFALSLTKEVLAQAIENKCDLIITHHPLIFNGIKTVDFSDTTTELIINCVKHDIQVYSLHTNLDITAGGVNDTLCSKLNLYQTETINDFIKLAELEKEIDLYEFLQKVKTNLGIDKLKLINPSNIKTIKKIAVCAGSGADFITDLENIDLYITGDIKYHNALDVKDMAIIDAGHFGTEKHVPYILKELLDDIAPNSIIANETCPWVII